MTEYRVVWQREGMRRPKMKRFVRRAAAEKLIRLLTGSEPWKEWGREGDEYFCCGGFIDGGYPCPCKGVTVAEDALARRADMPRILFVKLEAREVGRWAEYMPDHMNSGS